jgi:hypothetical protein
MEKQARAVSGLAMTAIALTVVGAVSLWMMVRHSGSAESQAGALASASQAASAAPVGQPTPVANADGRPPSDGGGDQSAPVPAAVARVVAPATATAAPPPPPAAPGDLTAQITAALHAPAADTALLATIARRGHGVPPEVNELIRRRQAGASPKELEQWFRAHPIKDIGDRVAVQHWLHEIAPENVRR